MLIHRAPREGGNGASLVFDVTLIVYTSLRLRDGTPLLYDDEPIRQAQQKAKITMTATVTVLYICGSGRSGSTILSSILANVDGIFTVGELSEWGHWLNRQANCSCGEPFGTCEVWQPILKAAFGDIANIDGAAIAHLRNQLRENDSRRYLAYLRKMLTSDDIAADSTTADLSAMLEQLYTQIHQQTGCRVIVDASKSPFYGYFLSRIPSIDVKFVHLVRHPCAVAYSWTRKKKTRDNRPADYLRQYAPRQTATHWLRVNSAASVLRYTQPNNYLHLPYRDFIQTPKASLQRLFRLIDMPMPDDLVTDDRRVSVGPDHSIGGNPSRFEHKQTPLRMDEAWRTQLATRHKLTVMGICGGLHLAYQSRRVRGNR